ELDQRLLGQRRGRASLHAGAARHAFGIEERLVLARGDLRREAAAVDRERERALDFLARANAARAHDALRRIEREVRIALVLLRVEMIRAVVAVAHLAQSDRARHVLQLAVAVRRARETVERMIGDVELHHVAAHVREALRLRRDDHALADFRRARCGQALRTLDLDEAQPARAERLEAVGRAELRDVDAGLGRGAQHRRAFGHGHGYAVDRQRDLALRFTLRRAEISGAPVRLECCTHATSPTARCLGPRALNASGKWSRMLITGYGAMPPSAHSEPATIVSHSSRRDRKSTRLNS